MMDARQQRFERIRTSEFGFWLDEAKRDVMDKLIDTDDVINNDDLALLDEIDREATRHAQNFHHFSN